MANEIQVIVMVKINEHTFVEKNFLDETMELAREIAPIIPSGEVVTAELILGPDLWNSLTRYRKIVAGMCMAYLARNDLIPYKVAGKPCVSPKLYKPNIST